MELKNKLKIKEKINFKKLSIILGFIFIISLVSAWTICIDHTSPSAPSNLILTKSNGNIQLNWNAATDEPACSGVDHYDIYRSFNYEDFILIGSVSDTLYNDVGLLNGIYTYIVHTVDKAGHKERNGLSIEIEIQEVVEGTPTGEHWDTRSSGNTVPRGITTDGTNIWVADTNSAKIFKYDMNGNYVGGWGMNILNDRSCGITTDGTNIWVADRDSAKIFKYDMSGKYIGSWSTGVLNDEPCGITTDGTNIWVVDGTDDKVYKYNLK